MNKLIKLMLVVLLTFTSGLNFAVGNDRVLMVLTSHDQLGDTGKKTGFWLPELTHPYYVFKAAGIEVDVASIQGGIAPIDPKSLEDPDQETIRFLKDAELMAKVLRSIPLREVDTDNYNVVMFAGGSGTMWDFPSNNDVHRVVMNIYDKSGIVSAICHGPAALVNTKLSNGEYLIKGKRIAAFSNIEEKDIELHDVVPFLLQDKLIERGAHYIEGEAWKNNVVVDGRLVTGQNPASASATAETIISILKDKKG